MTPGQLRNNPAHWQPCDRRITDHEPSEERGSIVVTIMGVFFVGVGSALALTAALKWWLT